MSGSWWMATGGRTFQNLFQWGVVEALGGNGEWGWGRVPSQPGDSGLFFTWRLYSGKTPDASHKGLTRSKCIQGLFGHLLSSSIDQISSCRQGLVPKLPLSPCSQPRPSLHSLPVKGPRNFLFWAQSPLLPTATPKPTARLPPESRFHLSALSTPSFWRLGWASHVLRLNKS